MPPSKPLFVDFRGQHILPVSPPPCARCRWYRRDLCSGPQTVESQISNQGDLLSCFDPERSAALLDNLDQHRRKIDVPFRILQGLPAAIPLLCQGMPTELLLGSRALYGIALDDLLRDNGTIRYGSGIELRKAFHLPPDGRICLIASVRDALLEAFWSRSDSESLWKRIRQLRFEFVTGTSFSVYEQQSRNGQLFNQRRNMLSVEFLAEEGIPVVPLFCEVIDEDLAFAAQWLEERPALQVIGGLAQGWRSDEEFSRFVTRMKILRKRVSRPLHFLIIGCSSSRRIPVLFEELRDVTVTTTNLVLRGVHGEWWDPELHRFTAFPKDVPCASRLQASFDGFTEFCKGHAEEVKRAAA